MVIAELLIAHGTDVNAADADGSAAIHLVIRRLFTRSGANRELLRCLVEQGANVNAKNRVDDTPLHMVAHGVSLGELNLNLAEYLLGKGADVNAYNKRGTTALHDILYANPDSFSLVKLLLDNGADPYLLDCQYNTPCDIASSSRNKLLIDSMAQWSKDQDTETAQNAPAPPIKD